MDRPELSAIVLGYRAGSSLVDIAERLVKVLEEAGVVYELVLVANYWPANDDPTPAVAQEFARTRETVRTVIAEKRGGMGWDMRAGFDAARGDYLIVIDGDAQNPVEDVLTMYRRMRELNVDVMKGRRTARFDGPYRHIVSLVYNGAFRLLFGTRGLWDINGKPKGLTRTAYEQLDLCSDDWFIDAEIVLAARERGLTVAELPVRFFRNDERSSFVGVTAIWEFIVNMLRRRLRGQAR